MPDSKEQTIAKILPGLRKREVIYAHWQELKIVEALSVAYEAGKADQSEIARLRGELADARRVLEYLWTNRGVRMVSDDMQRVLNAAGIDPFEDDSEQW